MSISINPLNGPTIKNYSVRPIKNDSKYYMKYAIAKILFLFLIPCATIVVGVEKPIERLKEIGLHVRDFPEMEFRISIMKRGQLRLPSGAYVTKAISVYSGLNPIDVYQINESNFGIGLLSPVLFGVGTFIPFLIAFPSIDGMNFIRNYYFIFLIPGYLMNPELKIGLFEGLQVYTGYSFNLLHEKRIRPVFSGNAGVRFKYSNNFPSVRLGIERIRYRSQEYDCLSMGMAFNF